MLSLAKVVKIHPESHAIDVEFMEDGRRVAGVQVLSSVAGGDFGHTDMSDPDTTGYGAKKSNTRDIYAVVDFIRDIPVSIGFLYPQVAQCLFKDVNRKIYRHSSDVYETIDGSGNAEFAHPSGSYLRIGTSYEHEDLSSKDYDKKWKISKNIDKPVYFHIDLKNNGEHKASITITPSGNVKVHSLGHVAVHCDGKASIDAGGDVQVKAGADLKVHAGNKMQFIASGRVLIKSGEQIILKSSTGVEVV
jgi:hypothetical protein